MTAQPSAIGFATWEAEDNALAEAADDTVTTRMQLLAPIDPSALERPMIEREHLAQYLGESDNDFPAGYGIKTFKTRHYLYGHGTTTAGALTNTPLAAILAQVFGQAKFSDNGGVDDGGGSATQLSMDGGSEAMAAGSLVRVGAAGDGRGNGQFHVVNAPTGSPVTSATLRNAMEAAADDGDVVYAAQLIYPISDILDVGQITSDGSASNNTVRWQIGTANGVIVAKGCVGIDAEITFQFGGPPIIEIEWATVYWSHLSGITFPAAEALNCKAPGVWSRGSLWINDYDVTTRQVVGLRGITVKLGLNIVHLDGDDVENEGQTITKHLRGPYETMVELLFEKETHGTNTWYDLALTDPNTIKPQRIVFTMNPIDGRSVGFHFPYCKIVAVPQQTPVDGVNMVRVRFKAMTSLVTTSELTLAPWVLALA
jgi:hypothetical protein